MRRCGFDSPQKAQRIGNKTAKQKAGSPTHMWICICCVPLPSWIYVGVCVNNTNIHLYTIYTSVSKHVCCAWSISIVKQRTQIKWYDQRTKDRQNSHYIEILTFKLDRCVCVVCWSFRGWLHFLLYCYTTTNWASTLVKEQPNNQTRNQRHSTLIYVGYVSINSINVNTVHMHNTLTHTCIIGSPSRLAWLGTLNKL